MARSSSGGKFISAIGMVMVLLGLLLFLSVMYSGVSRFGDFRNFGERMRGYGQRAVVGMGMFAFGSGLMVIGRGRRRGTPTASRYHEYGDNRGRDYDPSIPDGQQRPNDPAYDGYEPSRPPPERVVKIRCRSCSSLNNEQWNYCNGCGAPL